MIKVLDQSFPGQMLQSIVVSLYQWTFCNFFQGLKNHAVTMFEVGKLSDESLDSLLLELEKVRAKVWQGMA